MNIDEPVRARDDAFARLNELTAIIGMGAVAALGVFGVVAAETIPGQASLSNNNSGSTSTSPLPTPSPFGHRHHSYDSSSSGSSTSISAASGPPVAVTGGSH